MLWNSSMYFMYFFLFMSIWILLPLVPSSTLCILIFLLCFLFGLVLSTNHLKNSFSLIGTRGASLSLAAVFPAPFISLITLPPLLCFLSLPILDFSPPFFLPLMLLLVLSPHPSCQADWGTPLGRCWQTAAGLFAGLDQAGTPTKESLGSLATLLTGVIPPLHCLHSSLVKTQENEGATQFGRHMPVFNELHLLPCFGGLCRNQKPQQQ